MSRAIQSHLHIVYISAVLVGMHEIREDTIDDSHPMLIAIKKPTTTVRVRAQVDRYTYLH